MDDPTAVEVSEPAEGLAGEVGEVLLQGDLLALERAAVHELEEDLDFAVVVEHVVALDHVRVIDVAEDLDLAADLAPDRLLVVAVDHLEGVDLAGGSVDHLVDRPAGAAPNPAHPLELREVDELRAAAADAAAAVAPMVVLVLEGTTTAGRRGRRSGGRRKRKRHRQRRVPLGER
ncbi:hypothetical protein PanWU01x14_055980 [Parasponia andersonii]|uniref:Uncharacterized protein n=1 Tax=Parasponia andersonii TaxID=3476 RepID=A0A2P5DKA8_PARAD|nr:hypothetical protein PanWU01x14_055980 [Parasponia andersonii]